MPARIVKAYTHGALLAQIFSSIVASDHLKQFTESLRNTTVEEYRMRILQRVLDLERDASVIVTSDAGGAGAKVYLVREILALKRGYNILSPISTLPSEVLSNVFLFVALSEPRTIMASTRMRRLPWIRITHVCYDWRDVALKCPALWSDVGMLEPDCMEVILRRSQDAPIRVAARNDRTVLNPVFCKALGQTHRLLDVDIEISSSLLLCDLLMVLNGPTPLLQNLFLSCRRGAPMLTSNVGNVFHGAESLKRVGLQRCGLSWSQIPLPGSLTYLQLWNWDRKLHAQCRPSRDELVRSLRGMPHLQELDLFKFLPVAPAWDPVDWVERTTALAKRNRSTVASPKTNRLAAALPKLNRLTVYDHAPELGLFFEAIELSNTTSIVVGALYCFSPIQIIPVLQNLKDCWTGTILQLFKDNGLQTLTASQNSGYDDHDFQFSQMDLRFDTGERREGSPTVTILCEYLPNDHIFLDDYLLVLMEAVDLSRLQALEIRHTAEDPLDSLFEMRQLPMLKNITLVGCAIEDFVKAWDDDYGVDSKSPPPFPALSKIEFSEVEFDLHTVNKLADALTSRSEHSCLGSIELHVVACSNFDRRSQFKLQNSADNVKVIWDGKGMRHCGGAVEDEEDGQKDYDLEDEQEVDEEDEDDDEEEA